jgi:uncharacterized protein YacL
MKSMQKWLATTPEGTLVKVAAGAALGALVDWLATSEVSPLVVAITAAVVPVIVNYLNPADSRYGNGA